jgi:N-acetyl-gamma-glutamyl-phosphate reductase
MKEQAMIPVAILGASGYTGVELVRWLIHHPQVRLAALGASTHAGKSLSDIFPALTGLALPMLQKTEEIDWQHIQLVFCCLPHHTSQTIIATLPEHLQIIDLSADFRLKDKAVYEKWYGAHDAAHLLESAVYGLTEYARPALKGARLIANPGCYPTCSLLALLPIIQDIDVSQIMIDAKSGVSGAGRTLRESSLAAEVQEGVQAYSIGGHRHQPEIEQELSFIAKKPLTITFTPHLMPFNRGMLATIYVKTDLNAEAVQKKLHARYHAEPFVHVLPLGTAASTRFVKGSNHCHISLHQGCRPGQVILCSVIDNVGKGASTQAIQNMNVQQGWLETLGLQGLGVFP